VANASEVKDDFWMMKESVTQPSTAKDPRPKIKGFAEPSMSHEERDHLLVNNLYMSTSENDPKTRILHGYSR
jgi:hypothetical protein